MHPLVRALGRLALALLAFYLIDYASLRFQIPSRPQFGSVQMAPYAAARLKDGRTAFFAEDTVDQTCVRSVFPHFGAPPCWYLERQRSKRQDL